MCVVVINCCWYKHLCNLILIQIFIIYKPYTPPQITYTNHIQSRFLPKKWYFFKKNLVFACISQELNSTNEEGNKVEDF